MNEVKRRLKDPAGYFELIANLLPAEDTARLFRMLIAEATGKAQPDPDQEEDKRLYMAWDFIHRILEIHEETVEDLVLEITRDVKFVGE